MSGKIFEYLTKIKTAVYGIDVRDAIHDSIKECYDDVTASKTLVDNAIEDFENLQNNLEQKIENKKKALGKAAVWYRDYDAWGSTIEEAATKISKFDLIVGGGQLHSDNCSDSARIKQTAIINRARELNPNIKFFYYFSIASWRRDGGYEHILEPGGVWNEDESAHPGIVRIHNKWEHYQYIERALHMGGSQTEKQELVENGVTWVDSEGVTHTEDKYIYLWEGGIPFDGVFLDDAGMDSAQGVLNQGYKNMRDKSMCICNFAHARGLSVFVNQLSANNWYSDKVSTANPDGLPSALNEKDFILVESCHTQTGDADGYPIWRHENNPKNVYNYYKNDYARVGAKIVVNDYPCSSLNKEEKQKLLTYCAFDSFAIGAHYLDFNGDLTWEVPDAMNDFALKDGETLSNTMNELGTYTVTHNGHILRVVRPTTLTQGVKCTPKTLDRLSITIDGRSFVNAYVTAPVLDMENDERVSEIEETLEIMQASDKKTAGIYHRMLIDDWGKELDYTNLVSDTWWSQLTEKIENIATIESIDNISKSITFTRISNKQVTKDVNLSTAKYAGHTIEIGMKFNEAPANMLGISAIGSWASITKNNSTKSTLYPGDSMYVRTVTVPAENDSDTVGIRLVVNGSSGGKFSFENFYMIDLNEFEDDVTKEWYTNFIDSVDNATSFNGYTPCYTVTKLSNDSFEIEWDKSDLYKAWSGIAFAIPEGTFVDGHQYELGCDVFETNLGVSNNNIAFRLNVYGNPGKEYWFPKTKKTASKIYDEEKTCMLVSWGSETYPNSNGRLYLSNISSTNLNSNGENAKAIIKGLYLYDLNEENIVLRGIQPTNSYLQICRVTDKKLAEEKMLARNALYFTDSGKMFITDFNRNRIDLN